MITHWKKMTLQVQECTRVQIIQPLRFERGRNSVRESYQTLQRQFFQDTYLLKLTKLWPTNCGMRTSSLVELLLVSSSWLLHSYRCVHIFKYTLPSCSLSPCPLWLLLLLWVRKKCLVALLEALRAQYEFWVLDFWSFAGFEPATSRPTVPRSDQLS